MKKIKVLHISETFAAGVYTYIKDICQYFDNINDVESYVIYSGKRKDTNPSKFSQDFSKKVTLIQVEMEREISPLKDVKSTIALYKKIRKIKPDIIHLHSSKAGVIGRIASKSCLNARVYYTPNGYSFIRQDISIIKKNLFKTTEFLINKLFGGITIACGDTEFELAKNIGKAVLVRNGIDIKSLSPLIKKPNNEIFTIGCIGRLSYQKNPSLFNNIAEKFPNLKFIWIGDGELKQQLSSKNIDLLGWMHREDALKKVADFDVYIQTSLWEGLPFTIIEAMALGKPIIATNVIGNKDAVSHGVNGFLCSDIKDFETYINKIREDSDLQEKLGMESKTRSNKLFDRNKNFQKLFEIYESQIIF